MSTVTLATVRTAARSAAHSVAWYVRGILGEDAYDKYREHYEATHDDDDGGDPGKPHTQPPMMTAKEFWRDRTDRQDANPQGRCC